MSNRHIVELTAQVLVVVNVSDAELDNVCNAGVVEIVGNCLCPKKGCDAHVVSVSDFEVGCVELIVPPVEG